MRGLRQSAKPMLNVLRGKPILAVFEACLRCNSSCGYCNLPLNQGRYEMSRSEIARVFHHLFAEGIRLVFVQGGEPMLRRDLVEVLEDLAAIGFSLTLITNGTRLTQETVERLAALPLSYSISLDTLNRDRYRQIRGADQLALVSAGVALLAKARNPKYLTCIVSDVNRGDVLEVVRFARSQGFIPVVGAYHWGLDRYGKVDPLLQYERAQAAAVFRAVAQSGLVPRGYYRQYVQDNIDWLEGRSLSRCDAGRYSIAIDASGNVAPCLALPHAGNLLEMPLAEILARFDRGRIDACSARSSCNMLCSRVVGSLLRHPISAVRTPLSLAPEATP